MSSSDSEASASPRPEGRRISTQSDSDDSDASSISAPEQQTQKTVSQRNAADSGGPSNEPPKVGRPRGRPPKNKSDAPAKRAPTTKRNRAGSSDSSGGSVDFGGEMSDEELFKTKEDKERLAGMTEKEREQAIFERMEEVRMQKQRKEIERKMRMNAKRGAEDSSDEGEISPKPSKKPPGRPPAKRQELAPSDDDDDDGGGGKTGRAGEDGEFVDDDDDEPNEYARPSEVDRKRREKDALGALVQRRKEAKRKADVAESKKTLNPRDVFGSDDSDSDSDSSTTSSSSSSSSSHSSSAGVGGRRPADYSEPPEHREPIRSVSEALLAKLSRFRLAKFVYAPFFETLAVGSFVRVGTMFGERKYQVGYVLEVVETAKKYDVEGKKTNKGLKLRLPTETRVMRLEFLSNQPFDEAEFQEWLREQTNLRNSVPTLGDVKRKQKEIDNLCSRPLANEDVDHMLREKNRFQDQRRNFAVLKFELQQRKAQCQGVGDEKGVRDCDEQIMTLDEEADRLDRSRTENIKGISWINARNRASTKNALLDGKIEIDAKREDDPFTRKSGKMKMSAGSRSKPADEGNVNQPVAAPAPEVANNVPDAVSKVVPFANVRQRPPQPGATIDIDISHITSGTQHVSTTSRAPPRASLLRDSNSSSTKPGPESANSAGGRARLSLEEYRRRRQDASQPAD